MDPPGLELDQVHGSFLILHALAKVMLVSYS
jgi:hypothetical protein